MSRSVHPSVLSICPVLSCMALCSVCLVAVSQGVEEEVFECVFTGALRGKILLHHKNNEKVGEHNYQT